MFISEWSLYPCNPNYYDYCISYNPNFPYKYRYLILDKINKNLLASLFYSLFFLAYNTL